MLRNLLATTALATMITGAVFAQETTTTPSATTAPVMDQTKPMVRAEGQLASNIIGETVYNGTGDDAQKIGEVSDVVIGANGNVESVVIGVGGFLGIGEKNVAFNYKDIDWAERDGDRWIVVNSTKEQLQALAEFDSAPYDPIPAATTAAPATDNTAMAPAADAPASATPAPAENSAMAPAEAPAATDSAMAPAKTAAPDATTTAAIDRSTLTEMPAGDIRADNLVGTTVYGANDANLGEIGDVVLTEDGKVDAVIIDVGGFLGMGEKEVAVGMDKLAFMTDKDGNKYLYTTFTKEQLDAAAAYDKATWADSRDKQRTMMQ